MGTASSPEKHDEKWGSTCCGQCYCACGINVRTVGGIVVEVQDDPKAPTGRVSVYRFRFWSS